MKLVDTAATPSSAVPANPKKPHVRRTTPDRSQRTRLIVQCLFILLNVFLATQFYFFVRYFETACHRPPRLASRRSRWLAAHRRTHECALPPGHRTHPRHSPCGHGALPHLRRHEPHPEARLLRLALSRRHLVGIPMESGPQALRTQPRSSALCSIFRCAPSNICSWLSSSSSSAA